MYVHATVFQNKSSEQYRSMYERLKFIYYSNRTIISVSFIASALLILNLNERINRI